MNCRTSVFVLAGGRGSRMGPLCLHRPKPLLPMGVHRRLIDFPIANALSAGIERIAVVVDYQRNALVDYLGQLDSRSPQTRGRIDILVPAAGPYLGTADAIFQNVDYLEGSKSETTLILAADHVYRMDYRALLKIHHETGADVTIGMVVVPMEEAHRFGILTVDSDSRVLDFQEKPAAPPGRLASMGIYVFSTNYLRRMLRQDAADPESRHDFGHAIIPRAIAEGARVFGYKFPGFWRDVGTLESFHETSMRMLDAGLGSPQPLLPTEPTVSRMAMRQRDRAGNSQIAPGCRIRGEVRNSVIGPGCVVSEGAVVKNSVLFNDIRIGRNTMIDTAVIDEGTVIGDMCYVSPGESLSGGERHVTCVGRRSRIPSGTLVLPGCHISPETEVSPAHGHVVQPITAT